MHLRLNFNVLCLKIHSCQVLKLDGPHLRYLFVPPGFPSWMVAPSLAAEKLYLRSGSASKSCPAHPRNYTIQHQSKNSNNWEFNKAGEDEAKVWEEGEIVVRCSVHDLVHIEWLVQQGREGSLPKESVGKILCQEDKEGSFLLSLVDHDIQKEVAFWNKEHTEKVAHKMSEDFIEWLIEQASADVWKKENVGSIVCRENMNNQLIMATLDEKTQKQVAVFDKEKTCSVVPFLDEGDFLQWLYQEAIEGRWDQNMVFGALAKEEVNGKAVIVPLIRKGKLHIYDTLSRRISALGPP